MNKKHLSQNWLRDEDSLTAMVRAAAVSGTDTIVEVGPGPGTLTQYLVDAAREVIAVEFDRELAAALPSVVTADNLEIHQEDILRFDTNQLPEKYKVVANIPYHITAKIIQHFITAQNKPDVMALLVQKEVAERVAAKPGAMSVLAVSVQMIADVAALEVVPAHLFTPPPKVDSQVLQINLLDAPRYDVDERKFYRLVKAGFGERRKKLLNALAGGLHIDKKTATDLLIAADIDISMRAQELSLDMWYTLYTKYELRNN